MLSSNLRARLKRKLDSNQRSTVAHSKRLNELPARFQKRRNPEGVRAPRKLGLRLFEKQFRRTAARSNPITPEKQSERLELRSGQELVNDSGRHWIISKPLKSIWPASCDYLTTWRVDTANTVLDDCDLALLKKHLEGTVFLDLETCGFAGSMIFLVGLLHQTDRGPQLVQLWARNYAEEAAMLATLREIMAEKEVLATFNGKSFDWPQVRDRCIIHDRLATLPVLPHVDLLHHARRRFKSDLPNCKLQTLERFICGRRRVGDIPGSLIPEEYHRYVQTGDMRSVRSILHHNALDLVTLMQLALVLIKSPP